MADVSQAPSFFPIHPSVELAPTPNKHARAKPWWGVVIHDTAAASAKGSVQWLRMPEAKASAHFVIGQDGHTWQLAGLDECTWHAGISQIVDLDGTVRHSLNEITIGIELANIGPLHKDADGAWCYDDGASIKAYHGLAEGVREATLTLNGREIVPRCGWEPYPDVQIAALAQVLGWLADAGLRDVVHNLVGHEEIAVPAGRKIDPGCAFPWERFARRLPRLTQSVTF